MDKEEIMREIASLIGDMSLQGALDILEELSSDIEARIDVIRDDIKRSERGGEVL